MQKTQKYWPQSRPFLNFFSVCLLLISLMTSVNAHADRYIFDPSAQLRIQPEIAANIQKNYLPLFGLKNIGPVEVVGAFERFEYVEFPLSDKPKRTWGWIESRYLANDPPSPDLLILTKQLAATRKDDYSSRIQLAEIAIDTYSRGHVSSSNESRAYYKFAKEIADEYRSADKAVAKEIKKLTGSYLYLIGSSTFTPFLLYENGHISEWEHGGPPPDKTSTEYLQAQLQLVQEQWPWFVRKLALYEKFLSPGNSYSLIKGGSVVSGMQLTEMGGSNEGGGYTYVGAKLINKNGFSIPENSHDTFIATNAPAKYFRRTPDRATTKAEDEILLKFAQTFFSELHINVKRQNIKRYGNKAIYPDGSGFPLLVSCFALSPGAKNSLPKNGTTLEHKIFLVLRQDQHGEYLLAYAANSGNAKDDQITNFNLIDHVDLNLDGKDELIVQVESDTFLHYEILSESGGKYIKLIDAGFSGSD